MKITVERNVVEMVPENVLETASLELLWRVVVECLKDNKKLVPIGEYIPAKKNLARFVIEGVPGGKTAWTEEKAEASATYICAICNKYMHVAAGASLPLCCGRGMDAVD